MDRVIERGCGLDVHKQTVAACVRLPGPKGKHTQEVRTFGTTTPDLLALQDWLAAHQVTHVAMESTGVFWKPVYYVLEASFTVLLVNAAHIKQVPGRKTDVRDCQWIAELLEHGLLRGSFVPPPVIRDLRELTRYRRTQVQERTRVANRLHKVLQDANLKLTNVTRNVLGVSGRAMLDALVEGTTDPAVLADLARGQLRKKLPALRQALTGRFRPHHAFLVGQILAHLDYLEEAIATVSTHVEEQLRPFAQQVERLMTIPGVQRRTAETILAEIGTDMTVFPSAAHLASWAGMCPGNDESAGKRRSGKTRKGSKWLRTSLIEAGNAAARTKATALGARYRRILPHRGHRKAIVAVGRHILEISYHLLRTERTYQELGADYFDRRYAERLQRRCIRQLERLGLQVTVAPAPAAA
jgi:transposase